MEWIFLLFIKSDYTEGGITVLSERVATLEECRAIGNFYTSKKVGTFDTSIQCLKVRKIVSQ